MAEDQKKLDELRRAVLMKRVEEKRAAEAATYTPPAAEVRVSSGNPPEDISQIGAGISGFAQGLSAGRSDELIARGRSMFGEKPYDDYLTEQREHMAQAKQQYPKTFTGADIAGSIVSPVTKVLGPARNAGKLANIGRAALLGGVVGSGTSTEDPFASEESRNNYLGDTALGIGFGGATEGLLNVVGSAAKSLAPEKLKQFARERILKAATGQNLGLLTKIFKKGKEAQIADHLSEGVEDGLPSADIRPSATFGSKASDIVPEAEIARKEAWNKMKEIYQLVDAKTGGKSATGYDVAKNIVNAAKKIPKSTEENITLRNMLAREAKLAKKMGEKTVSEVIENPGFDGLSPALMEGGEKVLKKRVRIPMSLERAQFLKNQIKYKPSDDLTTALGKDGKNIIKRAYTKTMEDAVEKHGSDALRKEFEGIKKAYQSFATIAPAIHKNRAREVSNRFFSPTDYAIGAGTAVGGILGGGDDDKSTTEKAMWGIATALAHKLVRERGSSAAAITARELADLIKKNPAGLNSFRKFLEKVPGSKASSAASQYMFEKNPRKMLPINRGDTEE